MTGIWYKRDRKLRNFSGEGMTGEITDYITNCQTFVWAKLSGVDWGGLGLGDERVLVLGGEAEGFRHRQPVFCLCLVIASVLLVSAKFLCNPHAIHADMQLRGM